MAVRLVMIGEFVSRAGLWVVVEAGLGTGHCEIEVLRFSIGVTGDGDFGHLWIPRDRK